MRLAWLGGVVGPVGFLTISFALALARPEIIRTQGWASWPSDMALGGPPVALIQIAAFLWLAGCYVIFAVGSLRPAFGWGMAAMGYLAIAFGDVSLAFPTDEPGAALTWHGAIHLGGVIWVTAATLAAVAGVTWSTWRDPRWRPWRAVALIPVAAALIGLLAGFDRGWAKVIYVVGITLPGAVAGVLMARTPASGPPAIT